MVQAAEHVSCDQVDAVPVERQLQSKTQVSEGPGLQLEMLLFCRLEGSAADRGQIDPLTDLSNALSCRKMVWTGHRFRGKTLVTLTQVCDMVHFIN